MKIKFHKSITSIAQSERFSLKKVKIFRVFFRPKRLGINMPIRWINDHKKDTPLLSDTFPINSSSNSLWLITLQ